MAERYLIDTNAVIKYLSETFSKSALIFIDKIIDEESNISFISAIELLAWNPKEESELDKYKKFIRGSSVFKIDDNIIEKTIGVRKKFKVKIPDAIIASTALINSFTLVADNDKDFLKIDDLKYINPRNITDEANR